MSDNYMFRPSFFKPKCVVVIIHYISFRYMFYTTKGVSDCQITYIFKCFIPTETKICFDVCLFTFHQHNS
jgi:hypothetical protein